MPSSREEKIKLIKCMMQNHDTLCPDLFDANLNLVPEAKTKFLEIYDFIYQRSLIFFPDVQIKDFVISGSMCSYTYSDLSDLDLFIFVENVFPYSSELSNRILTCINSFLSSLSCKPKFYGHLIDYGVLTINDDRYFKNPYMYSILNNEWKQKPVRREYKFSVEELYSQYCKYSANLHQYVQSLEKINNAFLTAESCLLLRDFLKNIRLKAFETKDNSQEHEYSLDYNLYRLLKKFGTYTHFDNYVKDSFKYILSKKEPL